MDSVSIKNQKYGILVKLDPNVLFEEIESEMINKFSAARLFFEGAALTLQFEGRTLTSAEEDKLTSIIEKYAGIHVICLFITDEERNNVFLRARNKYEEMISRELWLKKNIPAGQHEKPLPGFRIYSGSILNGDIYKTKENIIVLGSVEDGGTLISSGSIIVLGSISGAVYAGNTVHSIEAHTETQRHFVASSDLSARKIIIDGKRYLSPERGRRLFSTPKSIPGLIMFENGSLTLKPLNNEALEAVFDPDNKLFLPLIETVTDTESIDKIEE